MDCQTGPRSRIAAVRDVADQPEKFLQAVGNADIGRRTQRQTGPGPASRRNAGRRNGRPDGVLPSSSWFALLAFYAGRNRLKILGLLIFNGRTKIHATGARG